MNRIKLILGIVFIAAIMSSCRKDISIVASGNITIVEKSFTDFTKLDVSNAIGVKVVFSDTEESIEVRTSDNIQHLVHFTQSGNTLFVKLLENTELNGNSSIEVTITTALINDFEFTGASHLELINALVTNNVIIDMRGASQFKGEVSCLNANIDLTGASRVRLLGDITSLDLDLAGASNMGSYNLEIENLNVEMSGASISKLNVNNTMNIVASGASKFYYSGDCVINNQNITGASQIIKVD